MSEIPVLFVIGVFGFLTLLMYCFTNIAFKRKDFGLTLTMGSFFLLCLIALISILKPLMIEDSVLIQIDATIIAGLLILLSISSIWYGKTGKPIKPIMTSIGKTGFFWTPRQIFLTIIPFSLSAISIICDNESSFFRFFSIGLAVLGFIMLIGISAVIAFTERKKDLDFSDAS